MAQQINNQTAKRTEALSPSLMDDMGFLEALFANPNGSLSEDNVGALKKRLRHRRYMQRYRRSAEYRRSDRAYNVMEYLVRCLRAGWEPGGSVLRLVGAFSLQDLRRRIEHATGRTLDLASYGVTWFFAHKKPIRDFDFSDPKQFQECVSIGNLAHGEIPRPWRKPRKKREDESQFHF